MNWKVKAYALAVLSRVPGGKRTYLALQSVAGTNKLDAEERLRRAIDLVSLVREAGREPLGRTFLEIGTGWYPFVPLLLYLVGAKRVITVDTNPWLSWRSASETFRALSSRLGVIATSLEVNAIDVQRRYEQALRLPPDLPSLLSGFNVEYRFPVSADNTQLPDETVDFVCSSNVLEHLPPEILRGLHNESRRILKPGGLAIHRFNPADHYSHGDKTVSSVNFLRYSETQWRLYGSGLAYHNRLRCSQHRRLLTDLGFSILVDRRRVDEDALALLKRGQISVDRAFVGLSPEDLAGEYMWLVGARTAQPHSGSNSEDHGVISPT